MSEQIMERLTATAEQLAGAAETLDRVLQRLDAQQEALNAKVDRIVAAVEEGPEITEREDNQLAKRVAELEKANSDLKAQAARATRKTLSPMVSALLAKSAGDSDVEKLDGAALDKALGALSVEQRIAVKAEMARAGMID